jgi:hypothetical protein
VSPVTAKWRANDVVIRAWKRPREILQVGVVNNLLLAIEFSLVAEMALFHALDVGVLEAALEGNGP